MSEFDFELRTGSLAPPEGDLFTFCLTPVIKVDFLDLFPLVFGPHWVKNYNLCCKMKVKICSKTLLKEFLESSIFISQSKHKVKKVIL